MKKIQKKARQDNKGGKDAENNEGEKKVSVKEEEQSEYFRFIKVFHN